MKLNTTLLPVILSGGAGTRLWPVSREQHPKPFMRLADGQSLLQKAYLRAAGLPGVDRVVTVTNRDLLFKTRDEYAELEGGRNSDAFILEPFGRNTAAAVAAAAFWAQEHAGADTDLLILPADHLVSDLAAFAEAVGRARELAGSGRLVTFGIRPDAPETGFGYIEADGDRVMRFVEKPDLETARRFVSDGRHLWNSGMFCFRADMVLSQFEEHAPQVLEGVRACLSASQRLLGEAEERVELDPASFEQVPDISLDYALMERSRHVGVVACDIGWSDIGSWGALSTLQTPDAQGNRLLGEALVHDAENCYVQSPERIVGLVGVRDLIVVDTPDAVLVAHRDRVQDVKQITAQLKASGNEAYKIHREVHRPWGTYTVLEEGEHFKIKRIVVKPQRALSLQMHHHRSEHWIVVSGTAKVVNGEQEMLVLTDESTYIPAGTRHRLVNPGVIDLVMIEVQSGSYLGEDDIVRFDDIYGRI
jgi:mannose-1-phosphate guanylyltransferase